MSAVRTLLLQTGLGTAYAVAGGLGLILAFEHPSATPVWPPTGIALAAGLVLGARAWPAVFAGAFVLNLLTQGTVLTSIGVALGNTLEGIIGTYLVSRFARGRAAFDGARTAFAFVVLAGGVGPTVAATFGVGSLSLGGFVPAPARLEMWVTWWLGDAVGALVVAPALLLWRGGPGASWRPGRSAEAVGLAVAIGVAALLVFGGASPIAVRHLPAEFVLMPLLMWAAFRFGPREAVAALLAVSVIAIAGTLEGHGPFAMSRPSLSLLTLQAFLGTSAATTLVVAAAMTQRRRAEGQLREWSVTDPLTGLANFRHLATVLDREFQRSGRTERPFALLLLDVDNLKRINDSAGHLVGSRALVRVGEALRRCCRAVDTAARYGGDEFAVVLPESGEAEARRLASRITARLAADAEQPRVSVCIGLAIAPQEGNSMERLFEAADRRLYEEKRARDPGSGHRTPVG